MCCKETDRILTPGDIIQIKPTPNMRHSLTRAMRLIWE
jgi:hypothetical protein